MYYGGARRVVAAKNYLDDAYDYAKKNPLISSLIGICVLSNIAAFVCFIWEVTLHPGSFNWAPLILTFGMFIVPQITARGRKNQPGHVKNYYDIAFVLYGAITHWICSFSVGYAGDSAFGCDWPEKEWNCDMGHPGIYGAFFFGIASITGHAFGWEKISKQRMARNWLGKDEYNLGNDNDRNKLGELKEQVDYGTFISGITVILTFVFGLIHLFDQKGEHTDDILVSKKWGIGALYLCILVVTAYKWKVMTDEIYKDGLFGQDDRPWYYRVQFAEKEKSLLLSVVNITLFVWLTGALWYLIGLDAAHEDGVYGWYIVSALASCGLAFWQHFHI